MIRIVMHVRENEGTSHWTSHEMVELTRVPALGEHISLGLEKSPGYKVTLVNHHAFDHPDGAQAEVFVVPA